MQDVQNQKDERNIYLNEVGIRNPHYPIQIKNGEGHWIPVTARVSMFADLEGEQRGVHMSRFVEILENNQRMDLEHMQRILEEICARAEAHSSFIRVAFEYFVWKKSPRTGLESYLNVDVEYYASLRGDELEFELTVRTPVMTLCPCSKEISDFSAHNQRAFITITAATDRFIWIEDLVHIAEESASSPVYSLLKRPDEKYITEQAYDNPMFVEDVAREVKLLMDETFMIPEYTIEVESEESIHNHEAYAKVVGGLRYNGAQ